MDPTKPVSKPKVGAQGNLPIDRAKPKKSFQETLAERQKTDEDEALADGMRIVEEQLAIHMSRSVLQGPKPKATNMQREKSDGEEDV